LYHYFFEFLIHTQAKPDTMKAVFLFFFLISLSVSLYAQNLVPNGDFEEYYQLPYEQGQLNFCKYWSNPLYTTPDYFHTESLYSSGFQLPYTNFAKVEPYSGNAIVGLFTVVGGFREFISVQLVKPLTKGKVYTLSFAHTNGTDDYFTSCGSDRLGVYFSKSIPGFNSIYPNMVLPQIEIPHYCWDTVWKEESFTFVAEDDYTAMTFGNFYTSDQTITMEEVDGETMGYAYFFLDKVELIEEDLEISIDMPNIFTPNSDGENDVYQPINSVGISSYRLTILNQWGGILFETNELSEGWDGQFNGMNCSEGTYFWRIDYTDVIDNEQTKSGFFHLVR
jgi:gliding motility-associated-like protein